MELYLPRALVYVFSAINVALALIVFPVVPTLGWINYGRSAWLPVQMPDTMLTALATAYYIYWHYWFVVAAPALIGCLYLFRRTSSRWFGVLAAANVGAVAWYAIVRLTMAVLGIRSDAV